MLEYAGHAEQLARVICIAGMAYIASQDLRFFRVPDHATLPLAVLAGLRVAAFYPDRVFEYVLAAGLSGGLFWSLAVGYRHLRGQEGLGLGDVKLAAVMGLWLGRETGLAIILGTSLALMVSALMIILGRRTKEDPIPLGAYLAAGLCLVLVLRG